MASFRSRLALLLAVLCALTLTPATVAAGSAATGDSEGLVMPKAMGEGSTVTGWHIRSSAELAAGGARISQPDFGNSGWYPVAPRSTIVAGLVQNGHYPNLFHSTNMRDQVDRADFAVPWWYRTEFRAAGPERNTFLRIPGAVSRADVWLNGTPLGGVVGTYNAGEFDIGPLLRPGRNALAIRVHPSDPDRDFAISWLDWAQPAPDNNMGIWRDVRLVRTGPVTLLGSYVHTDLELPGMDSARLVAHAEVRNNSTWARNVVLRGRIGPHRLRKEVRLGAGETRTVAFPGVTVREPRVWWPAQLGEQPLYRLDLTAWTGYRLSDRDRTTFGVREVDSRLNESGDRQFLVNGKELQIRSAGWASDLLLRSRPERLRAQLGYVRDLGLNAIRLEGKLETPEFYEIADRTGIMLLTGWECCDKWEPWTSWGGEEWTAEDYPIARDSMAAQARVLRSHPSVIAFLIGSDIAPPEDVQRMYLAELEEAGWPNPVIPAAASRNAPEPLGPSGLKMEGPYDWVPPNYWYGNRFGAAFGFAGELSAGHSVPTVDSLRRMLSPEEREKLWRDPAAQQFHTGRGTPPFDNLELFSTALAQRYGAPTGLADYAEKAQLANYENTRAQFEAYARRMTAPRPATGLVYWMLNNAWPSLNWHLYDYYLNPGGAYFGAKKGNEALHVQYSYDDRSVVVVDRGSDPARGLAVRAEVYDLDGTLVHRSERHGVSVDSLDVTEVLTLPELSGLSDTYFVRLDLSRDGRELSRNTYWLSTRPDVPDWDESSWYHTPVSQYADLSGLGELPDAAIEVRARTGHAGTTVTLRNTSETIAPAVRATLRKPDGSRVLPVTWSDNYVSLWPGESVTLRASYQPRDAGGRPTVEVGGLNAVPTRG
ncbi:glycosyl hydrolase 2 galactose-binding domain-containing protein [Amycolatopsis cihanbeyliensis]|uniref:Exo-1,4-beta-D-glucosaminidase n=1 Tax=Amycolatopsis cihanbeyliensis TaxID=1128664 RepID=A0A542DGK0_AMYCI|nr:glycoside hydrolase family 2 protein [Amycolatopsis cihanbeyliensis]TQJ02205.1 exo-1,4-beta-D-glucosaminidase [Amycolatopsis cihanbeyliensis]